MTTSPPSSSSRPLEGVRVLDLSRVLAGPFCTMILAQLGAQVIKVERPGAGDDSRAFGPFVNGKSLYFSSINYDKESIALDLKQPADRAIFEDLLGVCDIVVENFRPGTMEKLGYGWDTLHAKYPNLIYGAASGFGYGNLASAESACLALGNGNPLTPLTAIWWPDLRTNQTNTTLAIKVRF